MQRIENILTEQVEINQAVIFGDNKPFLVALIHIEEKLSKSKIESISKINKGSIQLKE